MALDLKPIRQAAERVATTHGLDVVDVEFQGNSKARILRVFVEKDAAGRDQLRALAGSDEASAQLPSGVPVEMLSGVTHEDCTSFAQDFGTLLDVEELVAGAEYTLEVSSPGLERRLTRPEEFRRFRGGLVKVQTFTPIDGNRHWKGRLTEAENGSITLDLHAIRHRGKDRKAIGERPSVEISLSNIEKANLEAEI